mgnify:CR=1 FL=1
MNKDKLKETIDKVWPGTKKELEKVITNTKKMLNKGEEYLKVVSQKSLNNTRKVSLNFKKEKLYYTLGKNVAKIPKNKWSSDKKINELVKNIKALEKEIKKIR